MFRTPVRGADDEECSQTLYKQTRKERAGTSPKKLTPPPSVNVRRSAGEWEQSSLRPCSWTERKHTSLKSASVPPAPQKSKQRSTPAPDAKSAPKSSVGAAAATTAQMPTQSQAKPTPRVTAAWAWLWKAKTLLGESRNLRAELKSGITMAVDALCELVKEAEANQAHGNYAKEASGHTDKERGSNESGTSQIVKILQAQGEILDKAAKKIGSLRDPVTGYQAALEADRLNYAGVVAMPPKRQMPDRTVLHSVDIAAKDKEETGEAVLGRVQEAVNAKDGWVTVEKVRKVKNQKIIMGCRTKEDRERVKERLKKAGDHLIVEDMANHDPMLVLRDVFTFNSDGDIIEALRNQNREIFHGLKKEEDRVEVKFRRKARNPLTSSVVLKVS